MGEVDGRRRPSRVEPLQDTHRDIAGPTILVAVVHDAAELREKLGREDLEALEEDLLLGGEVVVHGRGRHAGGGGDVGHSDALRWLPGEEADCGIDDRRAP